MSLTRQSSALLQSVWSYLRSACRIVRAAAGMLALLILAVLWLLLPASFAHRRMFERCGWALLLRGFGTQVKVSGRPEVGALLIANHISWIDIAALAYACDVSFVAKRDISSWPIIGMLATRHGCIFIDRGRRSAIPDNAAQISVRLRHGRSVVIFPEGTTGLGWDVLPMKSSLLQAVVDSSCSTIQPVAISYRNRDGFTQTLDERRSVAWLGDDQLLPHALGLARRGGVIADLWFGPIIPNNSRKELAASAGQAIQHYLDSSFKRPD